MTFEERFRDYCKEHSQPWCKIFHVVGVITLIAASVLALHASDIFIAGAGVVAWAVITVSGHYFEGNRPVFLKSNLFYSIMCDFKMCWMICTGRMKIWS